MVELLRGFAALILSSLFIRLVGFIGSAIVVRALGPADFGTFSLGLTVATLLALCINGGLDDLLVREIARAREDVDGVVGRETARAREDVDAMVGTAIVLRLAAIPFGVLVGFLLDSFRETGGLYTVLCSYGALYACLLSICGILRGRGRPRLQALLLSVHVVLIGSGSVAAILLVHSIISIGVVYVAATATVLMCGYALILREGIRPRVARWRYLVRTNAAFATGMVGMLVLDRAALIFLGLLRDSADAGWFSTIYNLVLVLANVPTAMTGTMLPHMSRAARRDPAGLERLAIGLVRSSILVGAALAAALYVTAPVLVQLLFGSRYEASVGVLRIVAFAIPEVFLNLVLISILEAADRQRSLAVAAVQSMVIGVPITLVATASFGLDGAAVSYVVAHTVLAGSLIRCMPRALGPGWVRRAVRHPLKLVSALEPSGPAAVAAER